MNRMGEVTCAFVILLALTIGIASAAEPPATSAPQTTSARLPQEITSGTLAPQMTTATAALFAELQQVQSEMIPAQQALLNDPELRALADAVRKAEQALARATGEALDASTDTARLRAQMNALQSEITSTALPVEQRRAAFRRHHDLYLQMRILEQEARNKPLVTALAAAAQKANATLQAKVNEKLRSNPQTARLLARREEIQKELEALRRRPPESETAPTTFPLRVQPRARPLVPTPTPAPFTKPEASPTTLSLTPQPRRIPFIATPTPAP
jgi:capsule polysaccharide export protein KpsE/RkpR